MHRMTDRKGADLFPYLLCSSAPIIHLALVHSYFIPFHIYWTPVFTKLSYSKEFTYRIGIMHIKPFLPATQGRHSITLPSLELIYLFSQLSTFYLNLEGSFATLAWNNPCSGQQTQNPQAGIVEPQSQKRPQEVIESLPLPYDQTSHPGLMLIHLQISIVRDLPLPTGIHGSLFLPDNVFLKINH